MSSPSGTPSVAVLGLGGTIAMTTSPEANGLTPALSANQLVATVPGLAATGVRIVVEDIRQVPGACLTFGDIDALAVAIRDEFSTVDGVVVIQGTDTVEETAYLLGLIHQTRQPVVFTGAMRSPSLAGHDGPANVLAAIQVAASPAFQGYGSLVVMADEIHAAARVRKTHTTSNGAFESPNSGPIGLVIEGKPVLVSGPPARFVVPATNLGAPRIGMVTITLADDGTLLNACANCDGLVVAAFGAGHVPAPLVPMLATLAKTMPVVLASRVGAGSVLAHTYGFVGSEQDLRSCGLIGAGFLDPLKARVLLHALLAADADAATIRTAFAAAGGEADHETWPWPIVSDCKQPARA
ncbi:asparaginase [Mycobacterium haemophilum]|uniref:Asparaginase n=1 Tax=Mycobacterium haemophilum TaxID=29311 RepID=A0A0I9UTQ9_9MYCO|nr:asparaginase [Mycobacterium haemophilum]KLO26338.1 asparaginase [Mycobacterium haemophilum]KLO34597.1 asparaginase [Mycobacterium haemophilum]KLO40954.1 asparaginase [Mycobacterium haemophilum]KLO46524.1 asparaginase [Mycobacterium haemophilum]